MYSCFFSCATGWPTRPTKLEPSVALRDLEGQLAHNTQDEYGAWRDRLAMCSMLFCEDRTCVVLSGIKPNSKFCVG